MQLPRSEYIIDTKWLTLETEVIDSEEPPAVGFFISMREAVLVLGKRAFLLGVGKA